MEEKNSFEKFLFGDEKEIVTDDIEFCVDRIIELPRIRPHQLEKTVRLSVQYWKLADFRRKLLEKSNKCPILIYRLYKRSVLVFEEIKPFLNDTGTFLLSYYFRKEIEDFDCYIKNKSKPNGIDTSFFENDNDIDHYIEYGFLLSSIEYCLKYDVIDEFSVFDNFNEVAKWSPFEWSYKPEFLDLLSFAVFFGSIKCFMHFLMKGFVINKNVLSMVVCGGCFDLFHICQGKEFGSANLVCRASEFFHIPLLVFMIENGADINARNYRIEFFLFNMTPLHNAAQRGHLSVVEFLVNQKADINAKT